jgi:hypothetical protein
MSSHALLADAELRWRQYYLHVDLYKFYLDLTIKLNIFHYAVTGAILSFYFSRSGQPLVLRFSLLLPVAMSVAFGAIFIYGATRMKIVRREVFKLAGELGFDAPPEMQVLTVGLWAFALLFLVVAAALLFLVFRPLQLGGA